MLSIFSGKPIMGQRVHFACWQGAKLVTGYGAIRDGRIGSDGPEFNIEIEEDSEGKAPANIWLRKFEIHPV